MPSWTHKTEYEELAKLNKNYNDLQNRYDVLWKEAKRLKLNPGSCDKPGQQTGAGWFGRVSRDMLSMHDSAYNELRNNYKFLRRLYGISPRAHWGDPAKKFSQYNKLLKDRITQLELCIDILHNQVAVAKAEAEAEAEAEADAKKVNEARQLKHPSASQKRRPNANTNGAMKNNTKNPKSQLLIRIFSRNKTGYKTVTER
jgi:hypothetical protein